MTVTEVNGYTLAEAIEFARTIRDDPGKVFDREGTRALKALAAAKERRRFDRVVEAAVKNSHHPDIVDRIWHRCKVADWGYVGGSMGKAWNEIVFPAPGPTEKYFMRKEPYYRNLRD